MFSNTVREIPKPEFYVVYTGESSKITMDKISVDKISMDKISISERFFNGKKLSLDLEATVITNNNPLGGVLSEYMNFVAVVEEQVKIYGRNEKAIKEAIKICKDKNILKEYHSNSCYLCPRCTSRNTYSGEGWVISIQEVENTATMSNTATGSLD